MHDLRARYAAQFESVQENPRLHYWAHRMVTDPLRETGKALATIDALKARIAELETELATYRNV